MIELSSFKKKFPNIYRSCLEQKIDPSKEMIPVAPAAHYICGGIDTDLNGATSVKNLYAIGECGNTGLHGANRLASNSLLEALALAHNASCKISQLQIDLQSINSNDFNQILNSTQSSNVLKNWEEIIQFQMTLRVGIIRSTLELKKAKLDLIQLKEQIEKYNPGINNIRLYQRVKNLCCVALMTISQSIDRNTNAGGFYKLDNQDISQKNLNDLTV